MRAHTFAVALAAAVALLPVSAAAHARAAPARWGPYTLEVVDEAGRALPTFEHRGRTYVLGTPGARYLVRVHNASARRIEVVGSVDGLDVVDGRPASFDKRGYLVEPWSDLVVDGFRLDTGSVAAFRFGTVARSYAARQGDARDVGVIGVAVFPERAPRWQPPPYPRPYGAPIDPRREGLAPRDGPSAGSAPPAAAAPAPSERSGAAAPHALGDAGPDAEASRRPGLGTEFGEAHGSPVFEVPFERESPNPEAVLTVRYDDRAGLAAAGVDVDAWDRRDEAWLRERAEPFRRSGYAEPPPGWQPW